MGRQHTPTDDLRDLRAVLASSSLSTSERIVLLAILLHRNGDSGRCDPSVTRLARQTGMDERSVRRVIRRLESGEYLLGNRREGRSTCYSVLVPTPDTESPRTQSPPGHDVPSPRTQGPSTPDPVSPERTKERTKERTTLGDESPAGQKRVFPTLGQLPRNGRARMYPPEFEGAFQALPPRHRSHPKASAYWAWRARVNDADELFQFEAAADAYREACEHDGNVGTKYVMQASNFFGSSSRWTEFIGVEPTISPPDEQRRFGNSAARFV